MIDNYDDEEDYYNDEEIGYKKSINHINRKPYYKKSFNNRKQIACEIFSSFRVKVDKFYFNSFNNQKNFFSIYNNEVDQSQHEGYVNQIEQAFTDFFHKKSSPLVSSIYEQWTKYGNISEKQLEVLSRNNVLDINLIDTYSHEKYVKYIDQKTTENNNRIIKEYIDTIKNTLKTNKYMIDIVLDHLDINEFH